MGQTRPLWVLLHSLIVHLSIDVSKLKPEYFREFELALHSPRDRAHFGCTAKGSSAEVMRTATPEVTISSVSFGISVSLPNAESYVL